MTEIPGAQPTNGPPAPAAPGVQAPKAVTQAPPWTGDSKVDTLVPSLPAPGVPRSSPDWR